MKELGKIFLILLGLTYGALVGGLTVLKFYTWFLLPVFTTLPIITFTQAIGISMFLSILKTSKDKSKDKDDVKYWAELCIIPWIILLIGFILKVIIY